MNDDMSLVPSRKRGDGSPPPSAVRPSQKSRGDETEDDWEQQEEAASPLLKLVLKRLDGMAELIQGVHTEMKEFKECMGGLVPRVEAVEGRLDEAEIKATAMKADVDKFSGQMKLIKISIAKMGEEIAEAAAAAKAASAKATGADGGMSSMKEQIGRLEVLCATMSSNMDGMDGKISKLEMVPRTFAEAVGGDEPMRQSHAPSHGSERTVAQALRDEQREHGCSLKLKGFVDGKLRGLPLLKAVREKLSDMVGTHITVSSAFPVLRGKVEGCVKVQMGSFEECQAVWKLGKKGTGYKLEGDQRMWQWYGPVEIAVRSQLYEEAKGKDDMWVARSALKKREGSKEDGTVKSLPLSAVALAKGLEAMHTMQARRA